MFTVEEQRAIGEFLNQQLQKKGYSQRQFCIEFFKRKKYQATDEEIQNMQNRISQIKLGNKPIMSYDLLLFSEILEVSCEEILSAGKTKGPFSRITNYSIAQSHDQKEWEAYLNREDRLFLNPDEYNKTMVEYAFEFKNYPLLKYLINERYIWFIDNDESKFHYWFGVGTKIERRKPDFSDLLALRLTEQDRLRIRMITLAIENQDYALLEELKARELPYLYNASQYASGTQLIMDRFDYTKLDRSELIDAIMEAPEHVLKYFLEEYSIHFEENDRRSNYFVFPFMSELIGQMLRQRHKNVKMALCAAIRHNDHVLSEIAQLKDRSTRYYSDRFGYSVEEAKERAEEDVITYSGYMEEYNIIKAYSYGFGSLTANIVHIDYYGAAADLQGLIDNVNSYYNMIKAEIIRKED